MADRVVFQMDQAAPANHDVLRDEPERRQSPNLDGRFGLFVGGNRQKATRPSPATLHNLTDSERHDFRENPTGKALFANGLQYSRHPFS